MKILYNSFSLFFLLTSSRTHDSVGYYRLTMEQFSCVNQILLPFLFYLKYARIKINYKHLEMLRFTLSIVSQHHFSIVDIISLESVSQNEFSCIFSQLKLLKNDFVTTMNKCIPNSKCNKFSIRFYSLKLIPLLRQTLFRFVE